MNISEPTSRGSQRSLRADSRDARTGRTRSAIRDAAAALITEGVDEITVGAIVNRAGIGRSSFYTHYSSVNDLAGQLLIEAFDWLAQEEEAALHSRPHAESIRTSLIAQLEHLAEHRALYRAILQLPTGGVALDNATSTLEVIVLHRIATIETLPPDADAAVTAQWIVGGLLATYRSWVAGTLDLAAPEVADAVLQTLPAWYRDGDRSDGSTVGRTT